MVKRTKMQISADLQFSTIDLATRKRLGINMINFRREFAKEMRELKRRRFRK